MILFVITFIKWKKPELCQRKRHASQNLDCNRCNIEVLTERQTPEGKFKIIRPIIRAGKFIIIIKFLSNKVISYLIVIFQVMLRNGTQRKIAQI